MKKNTVFTIILLGLIKLLDGSDIESSERRSHTYFLDDI